MADFISREAAEQLICETCERPGCLILCGKDCDRIDRLNAIPAADVRSVVREIWIKIDDYVLCANCGVEEHSPNRNYCHNCGADMRKVVEIDQIKEGAE